MSDVRRQLAVRFDDRSALIGVIGLGYVGLPLTRLFHDAGFQVLGFDIDPEKVATLVAGRTYLKHLGADFVESMLPTGRFSATADFSRLDEPDAILVCVPTPLGPHHEPELRYVESTCDDIAASLRRGQLVCLESTTFPGTTSEIARPRLEQSGLRCGEDFFLAYAPERADPGRDLDPRSIVKLVGGVDTASGALARRLYSHAVDTVHQVDRAEVAEAAKLLENIFRAVNIALINEMKVVLTAMDIDIWDVVEAASTKSFGFMPFYPGPGLGGHCIPIDPFYLTWKAREYGLSTRFVELAGEVNRNMPSWVVERVLLALNERRRSVNGARILILGLAYKRDVDDLRESPSFAIISRLQALGADVDYNDPHVPRTPSTRRYDLGMESVPLDADTIQSYDCVVVVTDHSAYDWALVGRHASLVVDTRNALGGLDDIAADVVKA